MNYEDLVRNIQWLEGVKKGLKNQKTTYHDRDKTGLNFRWMSTEGRCATLEFDAYHGYYGNSSIYSDMSNDLAKYVAKALNGLTKEIIEKAVALVEEDRKKLALQAKEEAQRVIDLVEGKETPHD